MERGDRCRRERQTRPTGQLFSCRVRTKVDFRRATYEIFPYCGKTDFSRCTAVLAPSQEFGPVSVSALLLTDFGS